MSSLSSQTCSWRSRTSVRRFQLCRGVRGAGRVVGRVQDQPLGARRDRLLEVVRLELEAGLLGAADHDRGAAGEQGHVRVRHPVRRRNDHLVAGIERRHQRVVDDLLAAGADADLVGPVVEAVLARELRDHRRLQLGRAVDRGVLGLAGMDRGDRRCLDVVRRVEIRLASPEADHVPPCRLQLTRQIADRDRRRRFDRRHPVRDDRHGQRLQPMDWLGGA